MPDTAELTCKHCDKQLQRKAGAGRNPQYCSSSCKTRHKYVPHPMSKPDRIEKARSAGNARWASMTPGERSAAMAERARKRFPEGYVPREKATRQLRSCRFCGIEALMASNQQSCGGSKCRLARNAERNRKYAAARRAMLLGAESEVFEPFSVYDRDGWVCQLCTRPVDRTLRHPDPLSVSLDHIIPLSRGGKHISANTQCSHLHCNTSRGNRFI